VRLARTEGTYVHTAPVLSDRTYSTPSPYRGAPNFLGPPHSRPARFGLDLDEGMLREAARSCGYDARRFCQHFGISRRHLQRWFSAQMDVTPSAWLAAQRLQQARRLLATSGSVKEVAYSLGFKQASQFSRDFRRLFGHCPSSELTRAALASGDTRMPLQGAGTCPRYRDDTTGCQG
jgi:AraC-like DNA-binding protein